MFSYWIAGAVKFSEGKCGSCCLSVCVEEEWVEYLVMKWYEWQAGRVQGWKNQWGRLFLCPGEEKPSCINYRMRRSIEYCGTECKWEGWDKVNREQRIRRRGKCRLTRLGCPFCWNTQVCYEHFRALLTSNLLNQSPNTLPISYRYDIKLMATT